MPELPDINSYLEKIDARSRDQALGNIRVSKACPVCNTTAQRIRYKSNESKYCPKCQSGGRLLADRSLSRLLEKGWADAL